MNIFKKLLCSLTLIHMVNVFGVDTASVEPTEEKKETTQTHISNQYGYWGIGAGIPTILSLKLGYRHQENYMGFEYGMGITPLVTITEFHLFGTCLFYPKPNLAAQTYFGTGLRAGGVLHDGVIGYLSPGVVVGREWMKSKQKKHRFIQVAISPGALNTKDGWTFCSSISLTFGYGF